ncbi:glycosyltransferase family 2 protein [Microbacterium sp.]|uniref:glycosyltransferase family 2 protein n=1 Tax=Microbacterium sp. TaxID=51671 RepID=UPI003A83961F
MTETLLVTVVVPFRNAEADLPASLDRLARLVGPVEIVLVDDASTDEGGGLVEEFCAREPRARRIRRDGPGGSTIARMDGVSAARGDYIWFCDIDDDWDDDIVATMFAQAKATDADLVACRAERVESDGRRWRMEGVARARTVHGRDIAALVVRGTLRGHLWNKLIRRGMIPPLSRTPLTSQDDFLMLLDIIDRARRVRLIPDMKYRYLERSGSISTGSAMQLDNVALCCDEAIHRLGSGTSADDAFRIWFHLVPAIATPVHRRWPADRARHRALARRLSAAGILRLALWQPSVAVHAAVIRLAGSRYPTVYRLARRVTAPRRRAVAVPS